MSRLATPLSALAVAGASIALVACGSSGDDSSSGAKASTNASGADNTQNAAFEKYRQCLKDHGVTPPAGGAGGAGGPDFLGGQPDAKPQKAMQTCAKLRPQGQFRGGQRPQQDVKAFMPYLTCLQDQGLNVKVSDGFNALRDLKAGDPKVQAAFKACRSKLPQRPDNPNNGRPRTTTSSNTT
jgi:hypothetical protein